MIDELTAAKLAEKIAWMPGYKDSEEYQDSLLSALRSAARDEAHGRSIVNRWKENNRFAPLPADLYEMAAKDASDRAAFDPTEKACPVCSGTGWAVLLGPMPRHLAASQCPGVQRCSCVGVKRDKA